MKIKRKKKYDLFVVHSNLLRARAARTFFEYINHIPSHSLIFFQSVTVLESWREIWETIEPVDAFSCSRLAIFGNIAPPHVCVDSSYLIISKPRPGETFVYLKSAALKSASKLDTKSGYTNWVEKAGCKSWMEKLRGKAGYSATGAGRPGPGCVSHYPNTVTFSTDIHIHIQVSRVWIKITQIAIFRWRRLHFEVARQFSSLDKKQPRGQFANTHKRLRRHTYVGSLKLKVNEFQIVQKEVLRDEASNSCIQCTPPSGTAGNPVGVRPGTPKAL